MSPFSYVFRTHNAATEYFPLISSYRWSGLELMDDTLNYMFHHVRDAPPYLQAGPPSGSCVGFTKHIGQFALHTLRRCRKENVFSARMESVLEKVANAGQRSVAKSYIVDEIVEYGDVLLNSPDLQGYFTFFAFIGEMCIRFASSGRPDFKPWIMETAEEMMNFYRPSFPGWDSLNQYARQVIEHCKILLSLRGCQDVVAN